MTGLGAQRRVMRRQGNMDNFDRQYEFVTKDLHGFRLVLEPLIQVLLEKEGIRFHSVTSRVKPKTSTLRKLRRQGKERPVNSPTDLLGLRVVTYFPDEVDAVANLIEREFLVDAENSVDKRAILDPDRFGYLSLHYIAQFNEHRSGLAEYSGYKDIRFELQIRSIRQPYFVT
jgi:ppGpp synthetase/RelA/SpoT-type nucleotidyltranferase